MKHILDFKDFKWKKNGDDVNNFYIGFILKLHVTCIMLNLIIINVYCIFSIRDFIMTDGVHIVFALDIELG